MISQIENIRMYKRVFHEINNETDIGAEDLHKSRKSFRCVFAIANDRARLQCDEKKSRNSSLESSRNYPRVPNSPGELRSGNR